MIANYHAHTWRCSHATGTERDYVEAALSRGLKIFGFSDHTPYPFPGEYYSWFRMKPQELKDYVATVDGLRKEFQDSIEIHCGVEAEYYPTYFGDLLSMLRDGGVEYMILGQHFLDNEIDAHYAAVETGDPELLKRFCRQSMDAMQTAVFTYFAHPDIFRFAGDKNLYISEMRQLCREAKSCGMPLEINLLGIEKQKHYPNRLFWEIAGEEGCKAILGCDTHGPQMLRKTDSEVKALAIVKEFGLELLDTVELRKI